MKKYISYSEFLALYPHLSGFLADQTSRKIAKMLIKKFDCTDIIETEGKDSTDIIATNKNNNKIAIEIKDRSWGNYTSKSFGDHFIEKGKLQSLYNRKLNGEFKCLYLISLFIDGVIAYTQDLEHNILRQGVMKCPTTTTLGNNEPKDKECVFYNLDEKIYFYFEHKEGNNFDVHFSLLPVNLELLNNEYNTLF